MTQPSIHLLLKNQAQGTLILDSNGTILELNEEAARLLDFSINSLKGKSFESLIAGKCDKDTHEKNKHGYRLEIIVLCKRNTERVLLDTSCEKLDFNGQEITRITLRPLANHHRQPRATELRRHRSAIATWEVAIYEHDHLSDVIYSSLRHREMYGFDANQDLTVEMFANAMHPDDAKWAYDAIKHSHDPNGDGVFNIVHRIFRADGELRWLHTRAQSVFGVVDGKRMCLLTTGSVMDVTREKILEEQLRQAQKLEAIGRLAGGIAHDFNNLLSVIVGGADLAAKKLNDGHPAKYDIKQLRRAAEQSTALTRALLAFSRKQISNPRVIDVNDIIFEAESMLNRLLDDTIQISVTPIPSPLHIKADPNQLEQVLLNLVINAKDAMPNGGKLTIATQIFHHDSGNVKELSLANGDYAVITVSDTGLGMDEATRQKIFEPFFTTKEPGQGTGLGLSTVFGIVKQSHGNISVKSEEGQGTTFKVYFPVTDESKPPKHETTPPLASNTHGKVVLLAEDHDQLREMVIRTLEGAGYEVLSAETSEETLELSEKYQGNVDLLLTDVLMPGMSGKELAGRLISNRPSIAVLYMSGYAENVLAHHGVLEEGINFISKPITPHRILKAIEGVLSEM